MNKVVAVVVGNGFVKTVWGETASTRRVFPSLVAVEQAGISFSGFAAASDFVIEFENKRYAIGDSTMRLSDLPVHRMSRKRIESEHYRVLLAAAISEAFPRESCEVSLIVTLPLGWYERRDAFKKHLAGDYLIKRQGREYCYHIDARDIRIVPEGFGVLAMQVLDGAGNIVDNGVARAKVGIVEIGTGTTDYSLFDNLQLVPVKSAGHDYGLSQIWKAIQSDLQRDLQRDFALHEIDRAIQAGSLTHAGEVIAMSKYLDRYAPTLAEMITSDIDTMWDDGSLPDAIYFAGGGAAQLYRYFARYKHGKKVDLAHIADAIGAFRYAIFRSK